MNRAGLILYLGLISNWAYATILPYGLNASDRQQVVQTLGLYTASKFLSSPAPLSTEDGFEIGLSLNLIDVRSLNALGCSPGPACPNTGTGNEELKLVRLGFAKSLYGNVDFGLSVIPPTGDHELNGYGGLLKFSFFTGQQIPFNLSAWAQFNQINYGDRFSAVTLSGHIIAGFFTDSLSLYIGVGQMQSLGSFTGGTGLDATINPTDDQLNPNRNSVRETVRILRSLIGLQIEFGNVFISAELDRYPDGIFSGKIGFKL